LKNKIGDDLKNRILRITVCSFLALLSYLAFLSSYVVSYREVAERIMRTEDFLPVQLMRLVLLMPRPGFAGTAFAVVAFIMFFRHKFLPIQKGEMVFAVLLSLAHYIGISFSRFNSFELFTASRVNGVYSVIIFAGFVAFFYVATCFFTKKFVSFSPQAKLGGKYSQLFLEKRPFLAPFCLFLVAWIPYFIIYFPGSLINDTVRQLSQFMGIDPMTNHHPIISTFFMGVFYRAGLVFGSANVGLAFITIVHNLMMASAFALSLWYMRKWGVADQIRMASMLFFAIFPVFGVWAQTLLKDAHASPVMLVFVLLYIDVIRDFSRKKLLLCVITAIVAALFRNEVIFVVTPSLAALALIPRTSLKRRAVMLATALVVFFSIRIIVGGAMAATDAAPGSIREALSIPFQQTARFMRDHEITAEESAVLAGTFHEYYLLGEVYNPRLGDPVKDRFADWADLRAYFRVWAAMGLREPLTYVEAAIAVSFSYVVPFGPDWHIVWTESSHGAVPDLGRAEIDYLFSGFAARSFPQLVLEILERVPVANFFLHTGNYTWAMALLVLLLFKRKDTGKILYFLPALMIILACMASPVHGYWRYYLPVLFMFPTLVAVVFPCEEKHKSCPQLPTLDTQATI